MLDDENFCAAGEQMRSRRRLMILMSALAIAGCDSAGVANTEPSVSGAPSAPIESTPPPSSGSVEATPPIESPVSPPNSSDIVVEPSSTEPATTTPATAPVTYPATTAFDPNAPVGDAPTAPVFVGVAERCPTSATPSFSSINDAQPMLDESGRLEPMLGTVVNYGGQHPDEFGGYGLTWLDGANASVFAMFTDQVEEHRAVLAGIVPFPEELIVCRSALTERSSRGLESLLLSELKGRFQSLGAQNGSIQVHLNATEEAAAADLKLRFGDAVMVRVGNFAYPLDTGEPPSAACESDVSGPTETAGGVQAALTLAEPNHRSGAAAEGTVTVTNHGTEAFMLSTGSTLIGTVVEPGTMRVLAAFNGSMADALMAAPLAPGESHDIPVLIGLDSCDPTLGYTLPTGTYGVVVPVLVTYGPNLGDPNRNDLVARGTLEVTAP